MIVETNHKMVTLVLASRTLSDQL